MSTAPVAANRVARGFVANLLGIATRVVVQLATLPVLFAFWPDDRVGSWLAIFALPAYFGLVATGFSGAGGTAALAAAQSGDMARARADYRVAVLIANTGTAMLALLFVMGGAEQLADLLSGALSGIPVDQLGTSFGWLAIYMLASSQMTASEVAFRVAGRYPDFIFLNVAAQIAEIVVIAAIVMHSQSVATLAMGLSLARVGFAALAYALSRRAAPQLFSGASAPAAASLAKLWKPSLSFMALPLVYGINLQGYLLLIGAALGPRALAAFAATRVLTRLLDLLANFIFAQQYYEAGYLGDQRIRLQRRQVATLTAVTILVAVMFSGAILVAGPWLQTLFTLGQTQFDVPAAAVLLMAATLRALAMIPMAVIMAENRHSRVVLNYLAGSVLGLVAAVAMGKAGFPMWAILGGLVVAELAQALPAFRAALARLDLSLAEFLRSLYAKDRIGDVTALVRLLVHRGKDVDP